MGILKKLVEINIWLVPNNDSKEVTKKFNELKSKIKDQIITITNNSDDYDEKYMKIKFNLDECLIKWNFRTSQHDSSC